MGGSVSEKMRKIAQRIAKEVGRGIADAQRIDYSDPSFQLDETTYIGLRRHMECMASDGSEKEKTGQA